MQKTPLRESASSEAFTAMDSSMGSSGGITLVMIIVQFSSSLKRSLSGFCNVWHILDHCLHARSTAVAPIGVLKV